MLVTGHQPNYLPYLGLLAKVARADLFVVVDNVQFVKRGPFGFQHRAKIRTAQGWHWLTVPVITSGRFTQRINEVEIDRRLPWRRKHWGSIRRNYSRAPHFSAHTSRTTGRRTDFFRQLYERDWERLIDLNLTVLGYLLKEFGITTPMVVASEAGIEGRATGLILDICRKTGASAYLHGRHGRDYADLAAIRQAGYANFVLDFQHPTYPQVYPGFQSNMAGIDLLFCSGGEAGLELLLAGNVPRPLDQVDATRTGG